MVPLVLQVGQAARAVAFLRKRVVATSSNVLGRLAALHPKDVVKLRLSESPPNYALSHPRRSKSLQLTVRCSESNLTRIYEAFADSSRVMYVVLIGSGLEKSVVWSNSSCTLCIAASGTFTISLFFLSPGHIRTPEQVHYSERLDQFPGR